MPPKVRLSHLALRIENENKRSAPNYRKVSQKKRTVAGVPARRTHFMYQERGSPELTNEAVQYVLVTGERAWIITMLTALNARKIFQEDFQKMVKGFSPLLPGESMPIGGKRKKRKRLRAGEMVNPDMIKY